MCEPVAWQKYERWLKHVQSHIYLIPTIQFGLCGDHEVYLEVEAKSGTDPYYEIKEFWPGQLQVCQMTTAFAKVDTEATVASIRKHGFNVKDCIRLGDAFWGIPSA